MCYNYEIDDKQLRMEFFDLTGTIHDPSEWDNNPFYSAFTFRKAPVIINEGERSIRYYNWGLIPSWSKSLEEAKLKRKGTLNARSETVFVKSSFRNPILKKRCLIPSIGFYEWREYNDKKYPYFIYLKDRKVFSFAGIYDNRIDKETGEITDTYSMLTVDANPMMAKIHNTQKRMPVILKKEDEERWLDPNLTKDEIAALLQPYDESLMAAYTIQKDFNKIRHSEGELLPAFEYSELPGI